MLVGIFPLAGLNTEGSCPGEADLLTSTIESPVHTLPDGKRDVKRGDFFTLLEDGLSGTSFAKTVLATSLAWGGGGEGKSTA